MGESEYTKLRTEGGGTSPGEGVPEFNARMGSVSELIGRIKESFPEFLFASSFIGFIIVVAFGKVKMDFQSIGYYLFTLGSLFLIYLVVSYIMSLIKKHTKDEDISRS